MESLLNRYRNITVLLLVIMGQLVLLAVSAKNDLDVRFIRIWTVTAVTPVARIIEGLRGGSTGFLHNYILLHDTNQENQRLRSELNRMKMENVFLKNELNTADRAKALQVFQQHTPSRTVAATIIATGAGSSSKVVFVDRGTVSGVQRGMAVVTPDGIVGKVIAAYPTASQVLLITDPDFAAGVVTQKGGVHGTLKGQGTPQCRVDYVAFEQKVEPGEWVYTSGDDRIFPRGFPVGIVKAVRPGQPFKEILVEPSGMQRGLVEDVLILIEGVHQAIPEAPPGMQPIYIAAPPPGNDSTPASSSSAPLGTEADRLRTQYQTLGEEQKHTYGDNPPGTKPADFTKLGGASGGVAVPAAGKNPAAPAAVPPTTDPPQRTEAGKNPSATPGAVGTPPVAHPAAPAKNATGATGPTAGPPNPEAGKNSPSTTGRPPLAHPAPAKSGTGGTELAPDNSAAPQPGTPRAARPGAPVKSGTRDTESAPEKSAPPPDGARRMVQPAGALPGGQLR